MEKYAAPKLLKNEPESCRSLMAFSYSLMAFPYFLLQVINYAQIVVGVGKLAVILDGAFEVLAGVAEARHLQFVDANLVVERWRCRVLCQRGPVVIERVQVELFGSQGVAASFQVSRRGVRPAGARLAAPAAD